MNRCIPAAVAALMLAGSAHAYVLTHASWPGGTATFYPDLQLDGKARSLSGIRWVDAFAEAAEEWSRETSFHFEVDTSDPSHPCAGILQRYPEDGFRNGAAFTPYVCTQDAWGRPETTGFGFGTLAVTMTYSEGRNDETITETDIFFNEAERWDVYDGPERVRTDFRRVALHELGHALGLDHEVHREAIMQPYIGDTAHLQQDDIQGVEAIYGPKQQEPTPAPILMTIEEPAEGEVKSGISTFRGWVVSARPLKSLSLYVDGKYKGDIEHAGPRADVGRVHPEYPDADRSGFARAFAFSGMEVGPHQFRLVARDKAGNSLEKTVNFEVVHYRTSYLKDDSKVSLDSASFSGDGNGFVIDGVEHDGTRYRVQMRWNRGSQGFAPVEITPLD